MTDVLQLAATGKASELMRDLRVRSLFSPYFFGKTILGYDKMVKHLHWHDTEMFVSRWARGVRKQAVEWPRAFYKTTTFTITCGIWHVLPVSEEDHDYALNVLHLDEEEWLLRVAIHDQDATQLFAFETEANAIKKLSQIRWHFEENELFRTLFPEIAADGSEPRWTNDCLTVRRRGPRRRDAEGTFEAIGVGGALQSRHYTTVWGDDLVGENARKSDKVMADTIGWYGRLSGAFENASTAEFFLISNRWGYADLNSFVRENEPDMEFYTRAAWESGPDGEDISIFPEQYTMEFLYKLRDSGSMSRYDFSCTPAGSPILMANWKQKSIEDVQIGDDVIGWAPSGDIQWSMKPSKVLAIGHKPGIVYRYTTNTGRAVLCTDDHCWWKKGSYSPLYKGSRIFSVYRPWANPSLVEQRLYDYLGGIIDGEGYIPEKGCLTLTQSVEQHPEVCRMIGLCLEHLKIEHDVRDEDYKSRKTTDKQVRSYVIGGDRSTKMRILANCLLGKAAKLISNLWQSPTVVGSNNKHLLPEEHIVKIELVGEQEVYWLETETGNYINQGFASKNCQYLNSPALPGEKEVDLSKRHYYLVAEDGLINCSCGAKFYPSQLFRYMHYDPYNAKTTSTSCPAIVVIGTSADEHVFLLASWTVKGSYANIFDKLFEFNDRYSPKLFTYEDVAHQNMAAFHWQTISRTTEYKEKGHRRPPTIEPAKTGGRAKEARIREHLFPVIEQRKFSTRKTMTLLDTQLDTFPNKVFDHDYDLLDCLAQGAPYWRYPENEDSVLASRSQEDDYLTNLGKGYSYASVS